MDEKEGSEMQEEMMTVLVVEPMKAPYVKNIPNELEDLQQAVGGDIEMTYPFDDKVGILLNGNGKFEGLPLNRALYDDHGQVYDAIAGTFLVVGLTEDDFTSLTPGQIEKFKEKYGSGNVLLYAMGDGNHSLATAKTYYENLKKSHPEIDFSNHPSRYALCEIVNLHSSALEFEAIHRLVYNTDVSNLISSMNKALGLSNKEKSDQCFSYFNGISEHTVYIHKKTSNLTVGSLQNFLDSYLKSNNGKLDYIHGKDTIKSLTSKKKDAIGFILPDMKKSDLFPTVIKDGSLPRKTFSMGRAEDKRFYIECRKIIF